jgi:hypothetical protein
MLDRNEFKYNIEANTLEEAFIQMGEEKSNSNSSKEKLVRQRVY